MIIDVVIILMWFLSLLSFLFSNLDNYQVIWLRDFDLRTVKFIFDSGLKPMPACIRFSLYVPCYIWYRYFIADAITATQFGPISFPRSSNMKRYIWKFSKCPKDWEDWKDPKAEFHYFKYNQSGR